MEAVWRMLWSSAQVKVGSVTCVQSLSLVSGQSSSKVYSRCGKSAGMPAGSVSGTAGAISGTAGVVSNTSGKESGTVGAESGIEGRGVSGSVGTEAGAIGVVSGTRWDTVSQNDSFVLGMSGAMLQVDGRLRLG
ncbi:hypothetical protein H257_15325 [Aphanomyces astaci]|uniref:Uncharacterized protein n=1 Tax=Aphanomyces astaci TaxID=112090 RepID=W4FPI8_APHAT|nr:hypothetical protein H257_15325 [Aphanomyces astaci]ETV68739.1 hypothetical protein H257_15325 [Aphanomyces astaci]|eukprot:XP_009841693.1 hypothetical protein H257_15325 [Aphanomyces astaci]